MYTPFHFASFERLSSAAPPMRRSCAAVFVGVIMVGIVGEGKKFSSLVTRRQQENGLD
jgi:hypothetical protein